MKGIDLKKTIKSIDLTQEEASKALGISRATLVRWMKMEELSEKMIQRLNKLYQDKSVTVSGGTNTIFSDKVTNPHIDNRQYYSDSPDVLRAQIDTLNERIKEKDAQIKEKDAQIKEKDAQIKEKDAQINKLIELLGKKYESGQ